METIIPFFLNHQAPLLQRICRRGDFFSLSWIVLFPLSKLSPKESPFALAPPSFFPLMFFFSFCFSPLSTSPLSFFFFFFFSISSSYPPFTDLLSLSYLAFPFFFCLLFFSSFYPPLPLFLASSLIKYHSLPLKTWGSGCVGDSMSPTIFYILCFFFLTIFHFFSFFCSFIFYFS